MAVDVKRLNEAAGVGPTNRQTDALDRAREISRRQAALLAAAGEAVPEMSWIVARTAWRAENAVENILRAAGVEAWYPVTEIVPAWRGGQAKGPRDKVSKPVWPGYLFIRTAMNARAWAGLLGVEGMVSLLGVEGRPIPVNAEKITAMRRYLASDTEIAEKVAGKIKQGDGIIVCKGPFTSFDGKALADEKAGHVSIELAIFGRATMVELRLDQVRRID